MTSKNIRFRTTKHDLLPLKPSSGPWLQAIAMAGTLLLSTAAMEQPTREPIDGVAAIVNDRIITLSDVLQYSAAAERSARAAYGHNISELNKHLREIRADALNTLIERALIVDEFNRRNYHVPDYIVDSHMREIINKEYGGNRTMFLRSLRARGSSLEDFRNQLREQFIVSHMMHREVADAVVVSPYKIEQYYRANQERFKVDDRAHVRMILLSTEGLTPEQLAAKRQTAEEILHKLNTGADFASMARLYSDQPQKENGGDWGWLDKKTLREDLRKVVFALKAGDCSDIIEAPEGFYILKVEEIKPAHVQPLAEVCAEIEKILEKEERARLQKQWVDRLRKKTFVRQYLQFDDVES